jgi:hypothetical protein
VHILFHDLDSLHRDMHLEEENLHDQTHGLLGGRLDRDPWSFLASWFVLGQPVKTQINPEIKHLGTGTHLQVPSTE